MSEIKIAQMKVDISMKAYRQHLSMFFINALILIVNIGFLINHTSNWLNAIAVGGLICTLGYVYVNLSFELEDLKFYKTCLNRAKWNDHDEIERLNSLTRYHNQFFTMDKKNGIPNGL